MGVPGVLEEVLEELLGRPMWIQKSFKSTSRVFLGNSPDVPESFMGVRWGF